MAGSTVLIEGQKVCRVLGRGVLVWGGKRRGGRYLKEKRPRFPGAAVKNRISTDSLAKD